MTKSPRATSTLRASRTGQTDTLTLCDVSLRRYFYRGFNKHDPEMGGGGKLSTEKIFSPNKGEMARRYDDPFKNCFFDEIHFSVVVDCLTFERH